MRMTSNGEVTIPPEVRQALGIDEGAELEWEVRGNEAVLRLAPTDRKERAEQIVGRMWGRGTHEFTTDELMRLTRGDHWNRPSPS